MRDMNFFSVYSSERHKTNSKTTTALLLISAAVVLFGGVFTFLQFYIGNLNGEIDAVTASLRDPAVQSGIKEVNNLKLTLTNLNDYNTALDNVIKSFGNVGGLTSTQVEKIGACVSGDAVLTSLALAPSTLTLKGNTASLTVVSSVASNLTATGLFTDVKIDHSVLEKDKYSFQLTCTLKGGSDGE